MIYEISVCNGTERTNFLSSETIFKISYSLSQSCSTYQIYKLSLIMTFHLPFVLTLIKYHLLLYSQQNIKNNSFHAFFFVSYIARGIIYSFFNSPYSNIMPFLNCRKCSNSTNHCCTILQFNHKKSQRKNKHH